MAHMIDNTTGQDAIAYVGETPWHGLGAKLEPGQDLATWRKAAGLDWSVLETPAYYEVPGKSACEVVAGRKVLFRSDTHAALSVMGERFNVVQPAQVLDLYSEIAKAGGFQLETAGALDGGRRIWALASVSDGAEVVNRDRVRPYVLLATSFDGSMATIAKFTAIRVVCNNTISMAIPQKNEAGKFSGGGEKDETAAGKQHIVRVLHSTKWSDEVAKNVRLELGIVHDSFERFLVESRALANQRMTDTEVDDFVALLLEPYYKGAKKSGEVVNVRETRGYGRIIELFRGKAIGAELMGDSRWAMLNAVTEFVDHERGRSGSSRLESAWFGTGNAIKNRALELLAA